MKAIRVVLLVTIVLFGITTVCYGGESDTVDYSQREHWLSLPVVTEKAVDIFFLYPSAWKKVDKDGPNYCTIDNPSMLKGSKEAFEKTAMAFDPVGNIFAPYYRQADAEYALSLSPEERTKFLKKVPGRDVLGAFDYYIKNFNKGRPFILAGHSQGSQLLTLLLAEYMKENPKVYDRMVAAYVIGYSITGEYLAENPHLKFAEGPDDTGVIISYNTEAPKVSMDNPVVVPGAISINPITWSRGEDLATVEKNLGSILPDIQGQWVLTPKYADARVDRRKGVVICSADIEKYAPGNPLIERGIFHNFDYPLYFYNIRANAANRVEKFLSRPSFD